MIKKTIYELAEELSVNPDTIRRKIKKLGLHDQLTKENKCLMISEQQCSLIKESVEKTRKIKKTTDTVNVGKDDKTIPNANNSESSIDVESNVTPTQTNDIAAQNEKSLIHILEKQIDILHKQLNIKDSQINYMQQQIEELTKSLHDATSALKAAQALHAGTMHQQLSSNDIEPIERKEEKTKKWWRFWKES